MKRIFALLCCLAPVALSATETLWVYGVNQHYGWYDADKSSEKDENGVWVDNNKCWAAVSANLINWWQDLYITPQYIATGSNVWATYQIKAQPVMANVQIGVDWWWTGEAAAAYEANYEISAIGYNTFNYRAAGKIPHQGYNYKDYVYFVEPEQKDLSAYLYDVLSAEEPRYGIGINVGSSQYASAHGITMWGAEFDEAHTLKALWVTDSDDAILNANGGDLNLFRVNVEKRTDGYYLTNYWYSDARYIESLTILDDTKVS